MVVVPLGNTHDDRHSALVELKDGITALMEKVISEHPHMLAVSVLGTLRIVEAEFIQRLMTIDEDD